LDWVGDKIPDYMRIGDFIPCNCGRCYFCFNGHTTGTGIAHAGKKRAAVMDAYKYGKRPRGEISVVLFVWTWRRVQSSVRCSTGWIRIYGNCTREEEEKQFILSRVCDLQRACFCDSGWK